MGLTDIASQHFKRFSQNTNEFGVVITFTAPNSTVLETKGFETLHHMSYDPEGVTVNTKIASVCVSMLDFTDYPLKDDDENVDLEDHKIEVNSIIYKVREFYPDEKMDLMVVILEEWQA